MPSFILALKRVIKYFQRKFFGNELVGLRDRVKSLEQNLLTNSILLQTPEDKIEVGLPLSHPIRYEESAPSEQNALDLFPGQWTSKVIGFNGPGSAELFNDPRIKWVENELGSLDDLQVLELGPLEGGHTYMLEKAGSVVLGIESNIDAFLRCLIVKNTLNLNAKFVLGDFTKSFGPREKFDLVVASGVLYHMTNPIELLENLARVSDKLFLWTHFYEPDISKWAPHLQSMIGTKWRPEDIRNYKLKDISVRVVPQFYDDALGWNGFCGGPEIGSSWIYREDLLSALKVLGFNDIRISFESYDHTNGPSFCILAQRESSI